MAKRSSGGVSGGNSRDLKDELALLVSHSLWIREEPVEMGSQLGPSVQNLQPGRRNPSSGMQPHPVSTGNTGWLLTPLHCPHHIFPVKNTSPRARQGQSRGQSPTHPNPLPNLLKQAALSFFLFLF